MPPRFPNRRSGRSTFLDRPGPALGVDAGASDRLSLVWQFVHVVELVSPIILPSPVETIEDLFVVGRNLLTGDYMLKALWVTTQEVLLGFVIAVVLGFGLGVLVGETAFGERAVMPYLVAINTMPKVAFAPSSCRGLASGLRPRWLLRPSSPSSR